MPASPEIRALVAMADAKRRRPRGRGEFASVRGLLNWYARARAKAGNAGGMNPRTATATDGSQHLVRVDGGRRGDYADSMAAMITVDRAIVRIRATELPQHFRAWWLVRIEDRPQNETAKAVGASEASVSRWVHRIDGALAPTLREAGMLAAVDRG